VKLEHFDNQRGAIMFKRNRLACSFCGKTAAEVAKLVAGPNVHICDVCAAEAQLAVVLAACNS